MNPVMLNANVPTIIPDIGRFKRDDDNADNAVQDLSMRVAVQEQALNALLRAFHGLDVEAGGDLYMEVTPDGIQFGLDRSLGEGGAGDGTSLPWYSSTDGVTIQCNGGLVLRMRGKNGYVYTDLADTSGVISVPTDGNNVAVGVSVDVSTLATCTATWTSAESLNALLGLMDADTAIWPVVLWNNTGGVYTKTIYHIGGALVLPMYG